MVPWKNPNGSDFLHNDENPQLRIINSKLHENMIGKWCFERNVWLKVKSCCVNDLLSRALFIHSPNISDVGF